MYYMRSHKQMNMDMGVIYNSSGSSAYMETPLKEPSRRMMAIDSLPFESTIFSALWAAPSHRYTKSEHTIVEITNNIWTWIWGIYIIPLIVQLLRWRHWSNPQWVLWQETRLPFESTIFAARWAAVSRRYAKSEHSIIEIANSRRTWIWGLAIIHLIV